MANDVLPGKRARLIDIVLRFLYVPNYEPRDTVCISFYDSRLRWKDLGIGTFYAHSAERFDHLERRRNTTALRFGVTLPPQLAKLYRSFDGQVSTMAKSISFGLVYL